MSKYSDIIERLEKATGPDHVLDAHIICAVYGYTMHKDSDPSEGIFAFWENGVCHNCSFWGEPTASIDDALAMMQRCLPGWGGLLSIGTGGSIHVADIWSEARGKQNSEDDEENPLIGEDAQAEHASLPVAILLALFRALEAKDAVSRA
jgi:hypothetical protein